MHEVRTRVLVRMRMNAHVTEPLSTSIKCVRARTAVIAEAVSKTGRSLKR